MDRFPVLTETRLLRPVATVIVPARTAPFGLEAFYKMSAGFYVVDTFIRRMSLKGNGIASPSDRSFVSLLLKENACDTDILRELPEEAILSTPGDFTDLFDTQRKSRPSLFLCNGRANNVYLKDKRDKTFLVRVRASQDSDEFWFLHDWKLDDGGEWHTGDQIVCLGTTVF